MTRSVVCENLERGNGRGNYSVGRMQKALRYLVYRYDIVYFLMIAGAGYIQEPTVDIAA